MDKRIYLSELDKLTIDFQGVENTPFGMYVKVIVLVTMNMQLEKMVFNESPEAHPYLLAKDIVQQGQNMFHEMMKIEFIESNEKTIDTKSKEKEEKHKDLFNNIWDRHSPTEFEEYITRYTSRIEVNGIIDVIKGKSCVDFGCGNGVFCFAMLRKGASSATGIDFSDDSINYASKVSDELNYSNHTNFVKSTVYDTNLENDSFDFAVQNGVFHHLDDEDKAIKEATRVLKKGGWFWYYTAGEGPIFRDFWDLSVELLKDVPVLFIEDILKQMNVSRNKTVHIMDFLSATYALTTWDEITERLSSFGFGNFKRLTGGCSTDFDLDRISREPYGVEKYGEGDLRILCQLVNK